MIDIAIPVLGRPKNAQKVVDSIRAHTTVPYSILFVCSPDDHEQIRACEATDAFITVVEWKPGPADFARKTNDAFQSGGHPWFFAGADDLEFTPGWDVEALRVAEQSECSVIGTNDNANPLVKKGQHATHMLFRRVYVEDEGASWDGPGTVYSESYDHQWVDSEAVACAKMRGQWAFAKNSLVLHHHPIYDRSVKSDPTYVKAMARGGEDRAVFQRRRTQALAAYRQR